jgi:hypothetical protein
MSSTAELRDEAVLRYVAYNSRAKRDTAVTLGHGQASLGRLRKAGLVKADPEFSGCLALTEAGTRRIAVIDEWPEAAS